MLFFLIKRKSFFLSINISALGSFLIFFFLTHERFLEIEALFILLNNDQMKLFQYAFIVVNVIETTNYF
jgi:hypothetical protein